MLVISFAGDWPADLQQAVERVFAALLNRADKLSKAVPAGNINLKLVNDQEIARLNAQSAGKEEPTDVLSFNYQEEASGDLDGELADIVISIETALRQAKIAKTGLADEVALLALHGILHVMGYDHATPNDQKQLDPLQADVLRDADLAYRDFRWTEAE